MVTQSNKKTEIHGIILVNMDKMNAMEIYWKTVEENI